MGALRDLTSGLLAPSSSSGVRRYVSHRSTTHKDCVNPKPSHVGTFPSSQPKSYRAGDDADGNDEETANHLISLSLVLLAKSSPWPLTSAEQASGSVLFLPDHGVSGVESAWRVPVETERHPALERGAGRMRARVWLTTRMSEKVGGGDYSGGGSDAVVREGVWVVDWVRRLEGEKYEGEKKTLGFGQGVGESHAEEEWTVVAWTVLTGLGYD